MKVRVTKRAQAQIDRAALWWDENRPLAPEAFDEELAEAFSLLSREPRVGAPVSNARCDVCTSPGFTTSSTTAHAAERFKCWPSGTPAEVAAPISSLTTVTPNNHNHLHRSVKQPASRRVAVTQERKIPTIGIGARPHCDGQVLVLQDLLGIYPRPAPKFSKNFMQGADSIEAAVKAFIAAVRTGEFPAPEHSFADS